MGLSRATTSALAARLFAPGSPAALALVRAAWPLAVGPELARRTQVLAIEASTLRVRVPDAGWRKVLHRMQRDILARLRDVAGPRLAPQRLGFTEGPVPEAARAPAIPAVPPLPDPEVPAAVATGAEAIADPEVRDRFLKTAARSLARSKGVPHA